jgi:hypothetical protein
MSIIVHRRTWRDTGVKARLPRLAAPLAALLYPFALKGFNASVTRIAAGDGSTSSLPWAGAAACLALAFAVPLIAILAAMSYSEIDRPTAAQLRAKRAALLAVEAPTLFTFIGVVLYMLHGPVPDTWLWAACWELAHNDGVLQSHSASNVCLIDARDNKPLSTFASPALYRITVPAQINSFPLKQRLHQFRNHLGYRVCFIHFFSPRFLLR